MESVLPTGDIITDAIGFVNSFCEKDFHFWRFLFAPSGAEKLSLEKAE